MRHEVPGPARAHRADADLGEAAEAADEVDVDDAELDRRRARFVKPDLPQRGWRRLYAEHVTQAHLGADMDFLDAVCSATVHRGCEQATEESTA